MIPVQEAVRVVLKESEMLGVERVALGDSRGRVLAEDIIADTDLPPHLSGSARSRPCSSVRSAAGR